MVVRFVCCVCDLFGFGCWFWLMHQLVLRSSVLLVISGLVIWWLGWRGWVVFGDGACCLVAAALPRFGLWFECLLLCCLVGGVIRLLFNSVGVGMLGYVWFGLLCCLVCCLFSCGF